MSFSSRQAAVESPSPDLARRSLTPILVTLGSVVCLLLALPVVRAFMPLVIDFGEGWTAYMVDRLRAGGSLYQPLTTYSPVNWPPLGFYLYAIVDSIPGVPVVAAGRVLSLVALGLVGFETGCAARRLGASRAGSVFAGLYPVGLIAAISARYVGMMDPQLLAHAVMLAGFLCYLAWRATGSAAALALTACLVVGALGCKHNLVALPAALSFDLLLFDRRRFWRWLGAVGGLGAIAVAVMQWSTQGLFLSNLLLGRRYSTAGLAHVAALGVGGALLPMGLGAVLLARRVWRRGVEGGQAGLVLLYLALSVAVGVFFAGGSGADVNMFFDEFVAVGLALGLALDADVIANVGRWSAVATVTWLALALPLRMLTPARYAALQRATRETAHDVNLLRSFPGSAYCEQMLLCYWAGKPLELQPYFVPEMIATGAAPAAPVRRRFESRSFEIVQLDHPVGEVALSRLPRGILQAIAANYRLEHITTHGAFYVPERRGPPEEPR